MALRVTTTHLGSDFLFVDLARSSYLLSDQPFIIGLMQASHVADLATLSDALRRLSSVYTSRARETEKWFALSAGFPGSNEIVQVQYRGVYPTSFAIEAGSRKLKIVWGIAVKVLVGIATYPALKDGIEEIYSDLNHAVRELHEGFVAAKEGDSEPDPRTHDVAKVATLERRIIDEMIKRANRGEDSK